MDSHAAKSYWLASTSKTGLTTRYITHGALRNADYWLVGGHGAVASLIGSCVTFKKLRGPMLDQQMADLPPERSEVGLPLTNVGIDVFGPWAVQTRRTIGGAANSKCWGLVFLCMASGAIHIVLVETMDTSSFLCALRRFLAIPGDVIDGPTLLVQRPRSTTPWHKWIRSQWQFTYRNKDVVDIRPSPCSPLRRSFGATDRHHPLHLRCHAFGVGGASADPRAPCHLDIRSCGNSQCPPDHRLTFGYRRTSKRKPSRRKPSSAIFKRWLPHKLSKRQSLTTVLFRTPITQMIFLNQGMFLLGSNHFLTYQSIFRSDLSPVLIQNFWTSLK